MPEHFEKKRGTDRPPSIETQHKSHKPKVKTSESSNSAKTPAKPKSAGSTHSPAKFGSPYGSPKTPNRFKRGPPLSTGAAMNKNANTWNDFIRRMNKEKTYQICLDNLKLKDSAIIEFCAWFEDFIKKDIQHGGSGEEQGAMYSPGTAGSSPKLWKLIVFMQSNEITDSGMIHVANCLAKLSSQNVIWVHKLYLFNNMISDEGAKAIAKLMKSNAFPILEIHLSHNRIAYEGVCAIFDAVKEDSRYPISKSGQVYSLWLRLEYNYIPTQKALEYLKAKKISFCDAHDRNQCGPVNCYLSKPAQIHLYVFKSQFSSPEESTRLKDAKLKAKQARELIAKAKPTVTFSATTTSSSTPQADPASTSAVAHTSFEDNAILASFPTYLFLDTNAVINMCDKEKFPDAIFTFENLLEKAKHKQFGDCFEEGQKVILIICDTVMQEVDHLKKARPYLHKLVAQLQSDTGFLHKCVQLNFMELLGAHQGEHLLQEMDASFVSEGGSIKGYVRDPNQMNDRKIIDIALLWNTEIGETGNVILITGDKGMKETAKRHNLPCEGWLELDKALKSQKEQAWTAGVLKKSLKEAFVYGGKQMNATPLAPVKSVYSELQVAVDIIEKLKIRLQEVDKSSENKVLLELAEENVSRWKIVIEQRNPLTAMKKKSTKTPGSAATPAASSASSVGTPASKNPVPVVAVTPAPSPAAGSKKSGAIFTPTDAIQYLGNISEEEEEEEDEDELSHDDYDYSDNEDSGEDAEQLIDAVRSLNIIGRQDPSSSEEEHTDEDEMRFNH